MRELLFVGFIFTLFACKEPSFIKVENNLSKAVIQNVEWGGIPISSRLMPGETSIEMKIYNNSSYYGVDLPEKHPLKFYINVNNDMVYLETKESINLGVEEDILIEITDSTQVINPLLENE